MPTLMTGARSVRIRLHLIDASTIARATITKPRFPDCGLRRASK